MDRSIITRIASGILAAVLLAPCTALAQEEDDADAVPAPLDEGSVPHERTALEESGAQERARLHFQSGASYYEAGAYEDALREWQRAYDLSHRPELLYNLSIAYQGLNDLPRALEHLRRFLAEVDEIPNRANLETRVANLQRRVAEAEAEPTEPEPSERTEPMDTEPAPPATPEPPPPPPSRGVGLGTILGFTAAGVGVVTMAIFGGLTIAEDGRLDDVCGTRCTDDQVGSLRAFAAVSDVGLGVAVVGAVVGTVFLIVDLSQPVETTAWLTPVISPTSAGAELRARF